MFTFNESKKIAQKKNKDLVIISAVEYEHYYVFFMQPEEAINNPKKRLMDSYVIVDYQNEEISEKSIFDFDNFNKKSKEVSL